MAEAEERREAVMSHYHRCPKCKRNVPGYRDNKRCPDSNQRLCGACTAKLFQEVKDG